MVSVSKIILRLIARVKDTAGAFSVICALLSTVSFAYTSFVKHESFSFNRLIESNLAEEKAMIAGSSSASKARELVISARLVRERLNLPDAVICIGSSSPGCQNKSSIQLECNKDPRVEAKNLCGSEDFTLKLLTSYAGGRCGYVEVGVDCSVQIDPPRPIQDLH